IHFRHACSRRRVQLTANKGKRYRKDSAECEQSAPCDTSVLKCNYRYFFGPVANVCSFLVRHREPKVTTPMGKGQLSGARKSLQVFSRLQLRKKNRGEPSFLQQIL